MKKKKTVKAWTWEQIRDALNDCYAYDAHKDDWGVAVLYHDVLADKLRRRLYKRPSLTKSN